jgi:nucleoside-diphosphate-sugar epimerase
VYADVRAGDVRDSQADISKARRILGYEPIVTFEEGLAKTVAWYRTSPVPVA